MPVCHLSYYSEVLKKQAQATVLLPSPIVPGPWHVMYLLHGLSDDHTAWTRWTSIERYVDGLPLVVVMPDGGRSFYVDAANGPRYGTALAVELPQIVRSYFPTKTPWCTTGLSMGGYGAIKLALERPDLFRSAVSHSGALHFGRSLSGPDEEFNREFRLVVGEPGPGNHCDIYGKILELAAEHRPALRFDCGTDDFLLWANREFHDHLMANGISHEYEEFPGDHNWAYWDEHVQEAVAFHRRQLGF
ncbi:MAG: esterase family protein [Armatimonadetes bacterium]|nr:esterase family protein [Armatimonadota bacterium]